MASGVGNEVEIQDVQIQEVEVESIPIEMPIEIVETADDGTIEVQPMIALQPMPDNSDEIVVQTREEIVGVNDGDPNLVFVDNIPVPAPGMEICTDGVDILTTGRKIKSGKKKGSRIKGGFALAGGELLDPSGPTRKWEQKQVQIKTLEGEFSVTMWASGKYWTLLRMP